MARKLVALDCDGVLADFEKRFYTVVGELFSPDVQNLVKLGPAPIKDYLGLDDENYINFMNRIFANTDNFPVCEGSLEGYHRLKKGGYDLIVVTSRKCVPETEQWLRDKGFGGIEPYFLFRDSNELPEFDYLLDDTPSKIARLMPWIREEAYLMKSPQNFGCLNLFGNFERVSNWEEFLVKMGV